MPPYMKDKRAAGGKPMPSGRAVARTRKLALLFLGLSVHAAGAALAQVEVTGKVPDEETRKALIARVSQAVRPAAVKDSLTVAPVRMAPGWRKQAAELITSDLAQVARGQFSLDGNQVRLRGEVANAETAERIEHALRATLQPGYSLTPALTPLQSAAQQQALLDQTLGNRIVEFDSGKATLTERGALVLDEMAGALRKLDGVRVDVIGHTDSQGNAVANRHLSEERAAAVVRYLTGHGIARERLTPIGRGPDEPLASNATAAGRARNRRIAFKLAQATQQP